MRRALAWMLALTFLVGGAAACSDDGDDSSSDTTEASDSGDSGDSGDGGNTVIEEYCDTVQEAVDISAEITADPSKAAELQPELTALLADLGEQNVALAAEIPGWSAEEVAAYEGCQTDFTGISGG